MTPERINDKGHANPEKLCACGCGQAINRDGANSKYTFQCAKRLELERQRRYERKKREGIK